MKRSDLAHPFRRPKYLPPRSRSQRGQSVVEFALVFPVAMVILALCATGGQMLVSAIDLTQAARAATVAVEGDVANNLPNSQQQTDAINAANGELGYLIRCNGSRGPRNCVNVSNPTPGPNSGQPIVQVTLWQSITPFVPLFPAISISAQASAAA